MREESECACVRNAGRGRASVLPGGREGLGGHVGAHHASEHGTAELRKSPAVRLIRDLERERGFSLL